MSTWKRGEEIPCAAIRLGDELMVDAEDGDVAVIMTAPGTWGLVHGCIDIPCRRLDNNESVLVSVNVQGGTIHRAVQA